MVRRDVRAPTVVIEDACQFAWTRLAVHAKGIEPETAPAWLAKTAVRHAVKLIRRDQRELSLEAHLDEAGELGLAAIAPDAAQYAEWHEQLESVRRLPRRQQTLLWLRAAGLGYTEIFF